MEGCKDCVKVVTPAKTHLHHTIMKEIAEQPGGCFVRVYYSFIVGTAHIELLHPEQVVLIGDDT